jgi:type III secretion protein F
MASTADIITNDGANTWVATEDWATNYVDRSGFDLIWSQAILQDQMFQIEESIRDIQSDTNLSDTEKAFSMQMAMNTWNIIANMRTNCMKVIADVGKQCVRNFT